MVELDRIICGDCLEELRTLLNESVDCCVTSPPYYGLRDYGIDGQIGLEPTPEAYVSRLVDVFREVRRVLKPEGTLFLNLGDSYFGSQMTGGNNGFNKSGGENGFKMKRQFKKPSYAKDVRLHGTSGKEEPNSSCRGCSSENLHDGRTDSWWNHISDIGCRRVHEQVAELCQQILANKAELPYHLPIADFSLQQPIQQSLNAILDQEQKLTRELEQLLSFQESTISEYARPLLGGSMPKDTLLAFQSSLRSLAACVQEFGYKSGDSLETLCCTQGNALPFSELVDHIRCTYGYYSLVSSWLNLPYIQPKSTNTNYLNVSLKPKDLIGIPWMVAFALRADGWYLRSDIIWQKPNCMPESCKDRPTKSHEYLFLLSKSKKYYYDAEAIREPHTEIDRRTSDGKARIAYGGKSNPETRKFSGGADWLGQHPSGRNKRTVWTIPTKPFPQAHFATFPEALVEPCILAGCPDGGLCIDPFFGAGTVGLVAKKLGRHYIGIELNPEYIQMAKARIERIPVRLDRWEEDARP